MSDLINNKEYKVFETDIDGTLFDDDFKLPEFNRRMLVELQKTGVQIVLCSGWIFFFFLLHFFAVYFNFLFFLL